MAILNCETKPRGDVQLQGRSRRHACLALIMGFFAVAAMVRAQFDGRA
jgi:hypothetical protein